MSTSGTLAILLLVSAALTGPVSLFLLSLYRRAVVRAMSAQAGAHALAPTVDMTLPDATPPSALAIRCIEPSDSDSRISAIYRRAQGSLWSAVTVYVGAGLAYAVVLTSAWVFTSRDDVSLTRVLWLLSCYAWPTALAVGMIAAVSTRQRLAVACAYFAMLFAIAFVGLAHNAELTVGQVASFWAATNAPATALLLVFLHRRVRAVGPLVLAFMVSALIGMQIVLSSVGESDASARAAIALGHLFGLDSAAVFVLLHALGASLFGILGWRCLRWIARRYQQRKMSDQSLTLDAMWLLFGVVQSTVFAYDGWAYVFTGLIAFAVYRAIVWIGFTLGRVRRIDSDTPTLLLLRVFALGGKSERLFDSLSKRWLRAGSIAMIAGPDLVTSAVEPHEFLDYVSGNLTRQFVRGPEDLQRRLRAMQRGPDPDGRYRVNEFFCYADTWKDTMTQLAAAADAVLMDLRSFAPSNQGCIFELQQLFEAVPLESVLFLIDDTTDRAFAEQVMHDSWLRVSPASPNRRAAPEARLLKVSTEAGADVSALIKLLLGPPTPSLQVHAA